MSKKRDRKKFRREATPEQWKQMEDVCKSKRRYSSVENARSAISRYSRGVKSDVYTCPVCGEYHTCRLK